MWTPWMMTDVVARNGGSMKRNALVALVVVLKVDRSNSESAKTIRVQVQLLLLDQPVLPLTPRFCLLIVVSPSKRCCSLFRNSFCDRNSEISACIENTCPL